MFCKFCGAPLNQGARFCIHCGKEIPAPVPEPAAAQAPDAPIPPAETMAAPVPPARALADVPVKPAPKSPKGRYWLFGGVGTAVGALLLAVILFAAGVLSFGGAGMAAGGKIEGPGFETPEEAAKAYLTGLKDQDINAMVSTFAVETYVEHYDLQAMVERLKTYTPSLEIRLPGNTDYNQQLNVVARQNQITGAILNQYMFYNATDELGDFTPTLLKEPDEAADFIEKFESDTEDYVFADLEIGSSLSMESLPDDLEPDELESYLESEGLLENLQDDLPEDFLEDLYGNFVSEPNQNNIERQAKTIGVEAEDVANVVVAFEANGDTWVFCPQAVRYNGKWYLQSLQGNLSILANMAIYTGGLGPIE
jgi:hypothetical protein